MGEQNNARYALAEKALEEYFARLDAGADDSFESLVSSQPEIEHELRELYALCATVSGALVEGRHEHAAESARADRTLEDFRTMDEFDAHYEIKDEVGKGGMGKVWRVRDRKLDRELAMKVILGHDDPARTGKAPPVAPQQLARFLNEAKITSQLDHPGIVPVHEIGLNAEGNAYFTMKLVKGRTLSDVFERQLSGDPEFTQPRVLSLIQRVCEAMAFAHDKGVIHRDLKPANVMIGDFGEVYVMDWGLARTAGEPIGTRDAQVVAPNSASTDEQLDQELSLTRDGSVIGTPAYMSPEQARGEIAAMGPQSDVYAIGAMLYQLIAGAPPYLNKGEKASGSEILARVVTGRPKRLDSRSTPPELIAICEKAMNHAPADRYANVRELALDLQRFLGGRTVRAFKTGAWVELTKWVQRNSALAVASGAAILLLIGGLVVSSFLYAEADESAKRAEAKSLEAEANARTAQLEKEHAKASEERAILQQDLATQRANDVLSLSASKDLDDLVVRADKLWPAHPDKIAEFEKWLADARELIDGRTADREHDRRARPSLAQHKAKLAEIRAQALPQTEDGGRAVGERRTWEFTDPEAGWWQEQLSRLVTSLEMLRDPARGLIGDNVSEAYGWGVTKRYEFARTIRDRSVDGPEVSARWNAAILAIATSSRYHGLKLTPEVGLLPIGLDPDSGLWEFAHLQSGAPAERGAGGKLDLTEETGLVFVLVPAGNFWMGAQRTDPGGRNFDKDAEGNELPVKELMLSAFFMSKYEMTQGQWLRLVGGEPSNYGHRAKYGDKACSLLDPVEQVSWSNCTEVLRRLGLVLPTEAQWEYAARAGTEGAWWTGGEKDDLAGAANLADAYCKSHGGPTGWAYEDWLDDGCTVHTRVGSYRANAFGLHDVIGNVWEWCRDGYGGYDLPTSADDGERVIPRASNRVLRGGGFDNAAVNARSASRNAVPPEHQSGNLGLRPAKPITP